MPEPAGCHPPELRVPITRARGTKHPWITPLDPQTFRPTEMPGFSMPFPDLGVPYARIIRFGRASAHYARPRSLQGVPYARTARVPAGTCPAGGYHPPERYFPMALTW